MLLLIIYRFICMFHGFYTWKSQTKKPWIALFKTLALCYNSMILILIRVISLMFSLFLASFWWFQAPDGLWRFQALSIRTSSRWHLLIQPVATRWWLSESMVSTNPVRFHAFQSIFYGYKVRIVWMDSTIKVQIFEPLVFECSITVLLSSLW